MDIYIDLEWFLNQKIFLVGYSYNLRNKGQLYGDTLTKSNVLNLFKGVDHIYFYGPDIAMLEKFYKVDIRSKYKCINLLKCFRTYGPKMKSYKLCEMEKKFGIIRETMQYKSNIFTMLKDWYNPKKRRLCLKYNMEDVINMMKVKKLVFSKYKITTRKILACRIS